MTSNVLQHEKHGLVSPKILDLCHCVTHSVCVMAGVGGVVEALDAVTGC